MRRTTLLLAGVALLAACGSEPTATKSGRTPALQNRAAASLHKSAVQQDLAALRRATAAFHDTLAAQQAGYTTIVPLPTDPTITCLSDPTLGAMGIHYLNTSLAGDPSESVDAPEAMIYEPQKNGRLRLVGVEYLIPYALHPRDAAPPELLGQQFMHNDVFGVWMLHAYVWKHNPSGMFATWNPRVSCQYAPPVPPA
ncbi:MAG TPA: hypothetical protein VFW98_06500 [Gemmatimonadaceae bacterium]|nr:hypothetical protein [Gemmatimonadaceae bacterium]